MATRKQSKAKGAPVAAPAIPEVAVKSPDQRDERGQGDGSRPEKKRRDWSDIESVVKAAQGVNNPVCIVITEADNAPELVYGTYGNGRVIKGPDEVAITSDGKKHPL